MLRSGSDVSRGGAAVSVLPEALVRATARGKFLFAGGEKLYVRGVTYGAFRPDEAGEEYTDPAKLEADFAAMAASGVNTVRIPHTTPPRSLLDVAARHGLRVMVGLSCEQYVGWLIDRKGAPDVDELVRQKVRSVAGHPALLCYALGNEIPATVARWLGARRIERYLRRLADLVRAEDPGALVTYVNYPTTEYLDLSFLDLLSFNVYLEEEDRFRSYLARLQNLAGDRPLLMTEIGLDSLRNGRDAQARALAWQIETSFAAGCAGVVVFSWTDEWHRAGAEVDDWEFGITDRDRRPKPAFEAVRGAFTRVPFPEDVAWPRISVVVCSYNGEQTIRECLDGLRGLDYPDHEVIVVDDGSTDSTAEIAARYPFRLIRTENRGLSSARNAGLAAATGEIVAYIDDDAYPDPHWLRYLAHAFLASDHAGIGGPNIPPPGDGTIAEAVAAAPGGPIHVLLSDDLAEHIPGCNMAFRRTALEAIGGFDTRFRVAGDDVDLCWRLQDAGHTIGFSPPAVVWHHRRSSVRAYWRQQKGYGKAEALLERKWPARYNAAGHVSWAGRVYGPAAPRWGAGRSRVFHGVWGEAPFQRVYEGTAGVLPSMVLMPEWLLLLGLLAVLSGLGALWAPLLVALPFLALGLAATVARAVADSGRASAEARRLGRRPLRLRWLTAALHLIQPVARLAGRLRHGLRPWRRRGGAGFALPWPRRTAVWHEDWVEPRERLAAVERALVEGGAVVSRGSAFDRWDLQVRGGLFGGARLLMAVEDHGAGTQYVRGRVWPVLGRFAAVVAVLFGGLAFWAALDAPAVVAGILGGIGGIFLLVELVEAGVALSAVRRALANSEAPS